MQGLLEFLAVVVITTPDGIPLLLLLLFQEAQEVAELRDGEGVPLGERGGETGTNSQKRRKVILGCLAQSWEWVKKRFTSWSSGDPKQKITAMVTKFTFADTQSVINNVQG